VSVSEARLVAGRYQLVRELGRGGMGVVWLAEDQLVGRRVAVKELRPPQGLADTERETFSRRALQEARSAARIRHPGAVTLYDVLPASAADNAMYLIMELVEGPSLAELIQRNGPLPADAVTQYGLQLLSVLEAAHGLGIVHRDIKPANILIGRGGQAKLTDFGIAHTVGDQRMTNSGVMGTQAYLAPELFEGAAITPAADLWSLGATLFAAVEGRGPFDRDTTGATLRAIILDELPAPHCAPYLAAAITGMLQRDPPRRATIGQARAQLLQAPQMPVPPQMSADQATAKLGPHPGPAASPPAAWQQAATILNPSAPPVPPYYPGHQTQPPGAPGQSRRRLLVIVAVAAAVVVAAAIAVPLLVYGSRQPSSSRPNNPGSGGSQPTAAATASGPSPTATLKDPGHSNGASSGSITGVSSVAFSPNGQMLAAGDIDDSIYIWNVATGQLAFTLTDPGNSSSSVYAVAFSPNGQMLAAGDGTDITYVWNLTTRRVVATLNDNGGSDAVVQAVAFSPNGQMLAAGDQDDSTYLWNVSTGKLVATLTDQGMGVNSVAFSPNGQTLAAGDDNYVTYLWNVATGKLTTSLTDPPGTSSSENAAIAFSPNGQTLAAGGGNDSIYIFNVATGQVASTLTDPGSSGVTSVAFSPDGKTLAVGDADDSAYLFEVSSGDLDTTLTEPDSGNGVNSVAFNPAGSTVATADADDSTYLWHVG
jgi:serine/threonine protein kinase